MRATGRRVYGVVLAHDGSPLAGLPVEVFNSDLSGKNLLGTADISDGKYEIRNAAAAYKDER